MKKIFKKLTFTKTRKFISALILVAVIFFGVVFLLQEKSGSN